MKTKKLLAALLSSAMVLGTMAVPVFAADESVIVNSESELQAAVEAGNYVSGTVELTGDLSLTKVILVNGDLTITGNGKTINSTASRILRVNDDDVTLTIKNTKFVGDGKKTERGLQVDTGKTGAVWVLENISVTGIVYYTLNICTDAEVTIDAKNSTFSGWGAFNGWSHDYIADFDNCTFNGYNDKSYNADGWNDFGTFVLEGDTTGATDMAASNCMINLNNCKINASTSNQGNAQFAILFNKPSNSNIVNITGDETVIDITADNTYLVPYVNNMNKLNIKAGTFKGVYADPQVYLADGYTETVGKNNTYTVKPADTVETTVSTAAITTPVTIKSAIDMSKGDNGTYEQVTAKAVEASALTGGNSDQRVFTVTSTYYDDKGDLQTDFTKNVTLTDILKDIHVSGGGDILCGLIITGIPNGYTVTIE